MRGRRTARGRHRWGRKPLVLQNRWPVLISVGDEADTVFVPALLDTFIVVQIELAIDNGPATRVSFCGLALSDRPSAVAAILWGIFLRITEKQIEVFFAGKPELGALIFG